jgi:hypothetical protein
MKTVAIFRDNAPLAAHFISPSIARKFGQADWGKWADCVVSQGIFLS